MPHPESARRFRQMYLGLRDADIREEVRAFRLRFRSEAACYRFLFRMKWPSGFVCPQCGFRRAYTIRTRRWPLYECRFCRHQTTLYAGSVMARTRVSPRQWLLAIWLVSRLPDGISAPRLKAQLGVTYKTAFSMLRKIRSIITQADERRPLTDLVKVIGLRFTPRVELIDYTKPGPPVLVAATFAKDATPVRVKMKAVDEGNLNFFSRYPSVIGAWAERHVDTGSGKLAVARASDVRNMMPLPAWFRDACERTYRVYCGVSRAFLHGYLDEHCFRLNGILTRRLTPRSREMKVRVWSAEEQTSFVPFGRTAPVNTDLAECTGNDLSGGSALQMYVPVNLLPEMYLSRTDVPEGLPPLEEELARWCMSMPARQTRAFPIQVPVPPWLAQVS